MIQQLVSDPEERSRALLDGRLTARQKGAPQAWSRPRSRQPAPQKCTVRHFGHANAVPSPQKPQTPGREMRTGWVAWRGALGALVGSMVARKVARAIREKPHSGGGVLRLERVQQLAVKNAELAAKSTMEAQMHARYIQGLRDGAKLQSGQGLPSPGPPSSAH